MSNERCIKHHSVCSPISRHHHKPMYHPHYIPNLASCDFHLCILKDLANIEMKAVSEEDEVDGEQYGGEFAQPTKEESDSMMRVLKQ